MNNFRDDRIGCPPRPWLLTVVLETRLCIGHKGGMNSHLNEAVTAKTIEWIPPSPTFAKFADKHPNITAESDQLVQNQLGRLASRRADVQPRPGDRSQTLKANEEQTGNPSAVVIALYGLPNVCKAIQAVCLQRILV
jgi:hypothetical protein